jgi:ComF family protein
VTSVQARWKRATATLGQFLFPRACAACDALLEDTDRGIICGRCWARLPQLPAPRCDRCGHPRAEYGACAGCALLEPFVRAARSLCWVPHPTSSAILSALKYDGWPAVAADVGRRMARLPWPRDVVEERSAIVPVPLAPVKERARGFNQAERIAAAVGRAWELPVWCDVLRRSRATPSQTRLTPWERLANVHGAFLADESAPERIRGTHLVLVDDVLTTGATLNACAHALFAAGARTISYLTFGRARAGADR